MRHLLDTTDLSIREIDELIATAEDIMLNPKRYQDVCARKKLATLFFEPSTRTRLSFEAAMLELGGQVIGFASANTSSAAKGESVADTVRMVNCYADIIAMRHPAEGAAMVGMQYAEIPVINAGDGSHHHPTQTLADLLTIHRRRGGLSGLTIGICGDLKYGRTVHSLLNAMSRYDGNKYVLISPRELRVPKYLRIDMEARGAVWRETDSLEEAMPELDILYMTRVQLERFTGEREHMRLRDSFILDAAKLKTAKKDLCIMHPLPRVNEIGTDVDDDPRVAYFEQALHGKYMRMALIMKLMDSLHEPDTNRERYERVENMGCDNPRCVMLQERGVKPLFVKEGKNYRCAYCDAKGVEL